MNKWDMRFLNLAKVIGSYSKDPSTQCGCVITKGNEIVSTGFNGYPRDVKDSLLEDSREIKLAKTIHAEVNAILFAKRDLTDHTLYVTPIPPCGPCSAVIVQTGITRVVVGRIRDLDISRWYETCKVGMDMFDQADVKWEIVELC